MEGRRIPVIHVGGLNTDHDPILAFIGEGIRQSIDAQDGEAARSWMDCLHDVQEHRAVAAVAAAWN